MGNLFTRAALALIVSILTMCQLTLGTADAAPSFPAADPDPFYWAPANLASYQPGDVVRVRRISEAHMAWYAGAEGWNVAFRSTNSSGDPVLGMTTVMKPRGVANPPLVSYQAIINSIGTRCNPSRSLWNTELNDAPGIELPLGRGWALNIPDHEGPDVAYGAARYGGIITLDSIRAVKKVAEIGLVDAPTVLAGYSGGAMASAWAAALQPTYAPELKLAGVAVGGIPADFEAMIRSVGFANHPGFGLGFAAAIGLERQYPDKLPVSDYLNAHGLWLRDFMTNECRRFLIFHGFMRSARDVVNDKPLPTDDPNAMEVIRGNSLRYDDHMPTVPMLIWHGIGDALTPYDAVLDVARRYCGGGVALQFNRYDISEHMSAAVMGFPAAWAWVDQIFSGTPAPSNCATIDFAGPGTGPINTPFLPVAKPTMPAPVPPLAPPAAKPGMPVPALPPVPKVQLPTVPVPTVPLPALPVPSLPVPSLPVPPIRLPGMSR